MRYFPQSGELQILTPAGLVLYTVPMRTLAQLLHLILGASLANPSAVAPSIDIHLTPPPQSPPIQVVRPVSNPVGE